MLIRLGYSYSMWQRGIKSVFSWNTDHTPHMMIAGTTGGGKTVLSQLICNQLLDAGKDITICDFKAGGDWDNIVQKYAEYTDCDALFNSFYNDFQTSIHNKEKVDKYLIFDEFSSYALTKDNKAFKELMDKLGHLAFMSRSFGYHIILISQQFSSKVLDTAIREQLGIKIYMGSTISTESATMYFPNSGIDKSIHLPKCCGYVSLPEKELDIIQIPYLSEPHKLKKLLIQKGNKVVN